MRDLRLPLYKGRRKRGQFERINTTVAAALARGQSVISVDTKKDELPGHSRTPAGNAASRGEPIEIKVHDFVDAELGRASPYRAHDVGADQGWVSVGTDHECA